MNFGCCKFFILCIFLLSCFDAVAADTRQLVSTRIRMPIMIVIDDPNAPKPALDDAGADEDESELEDVQAGTCVGCGGAMPSPLGPGQGMVELTTSALVRAAYKNYSESTEILAMIAAARTHIEDNPNRYIAWRRVKGKLRKTTFCYRAVKEAMRASGVVPTVFTGGGEARMAVRDLSGLGFRNLLDDENIMEILTNNPKMAPKGAILVYDTVPRSGPSPAGHIEIKTEESGEDGYISVSETELPTYGFAIPAKRRLIGVMIKDAPQP